MGDTSRRTETAVNVEITPLELPTQQGQYFSQILGMIPTVSTVPTKAPNRLIDQIQIYSSGGVYRLYIYDTSGQAWRYASLT